MATTLTSAGGTSWITDGTGPTLQIKGLTDGVGIKVDSTSTTLATRLKNINETQRFADDFFYHTEGAAVGVSNASSPFKKSNIWNASTTTMAQCTEWPGGGCGVTKFENHLSTGALSWTLQATGAGMVPGSAEFTYETSIYMDTPSSSDWILIFGLNSSSGVLGFDMNLASSVFLTTRSPGLSTATTSYIATLYNQWNTFKIVVNSALSSVTFYLNGVSVGTRGTLPSTTYWPYFSTVRTATMSTYSYYIDYVEMVKDIAR